QGAIAAKAFESAKNLTRDRGIRESLDVLATAAKAGNPIIPQDVMGRRTGKMKATGSASPADRASMALSLGMIYHITRRHDQADAFFTRVVGAPASKGKRAVMSMRGATTPQLAFAVFCKGAVLQARNKIPEAKEHFITSIKTFRKGTWHDETLYRIAKTIQRQASAKIAKATPKVDPAGGKQARTTKPDTKAAAKAKVRAALATKIKTKARDEVHVYWQELINRYPKSPRCEQAIYNDGVLLCELAQAAPPATKKSAKLWKDAAFMLARFCE
ncbi:MAG: hypothetical protein GY794_03130, partial [bacterium]|nr:hypothetical protein [bacterium]